MIRLLKLEYLKNLNYNPFRIFAGLYFIVLILLLFIGLINFDLAGLKINLKEQGMYDFPGIWNFTTYIVGLLKIFLGCIIVFSICQEFSNRMFKQNIIDGLSREEFVASKLLTIFVFTGFSTLIVFIIAFILGKSYSTTQENDLIFKEIYFIFNYFLKLFTFFSFLMFLSVLFRKSIFVFLGFFMIWFVEGILSGIEKFSLMNNVAPKEQGKIMIDHVFLTDYLPLGSMSNLIPSPLVRTNMAKMFGMEFKFEYPIESVIACIIWSVIFIAGSYWILRKKDW
ncbi:ABC transporter permease [Epilithonimonas arachidiradicis]|uniref:ABC transporter permease n=1 Tax=Epilithonimonas arachidiradicis TaxID=1617282 RepID=A0A420CPZ2_9FLAO|nr:ABC transporter permease subunit [Epilithonimonas arachidiradicis]RKE80479.1 ABC-type transport system involved in multi-copper enzyme maturation permease subunit [Epilithonimonas arachidiradicis]GGG63463.1 ABC transporter permease [Epilithonimonas arachidiradicis]